MYVHTYYILYSLFYSYFAESETQGRRMAGEKVSFSESEGPFVLDVIGGVSGVDEKTAAELTKEQEALEEQNVDTLTEALHRYIFFFYV
jgi:hypothetical protein